MDHQLLVRRCPWTDGGIGFQHGHTMAAVAEVKEELVIAVALVVAPGNGRCPRDAIALVPFTWCPPRADFLRVDGAVEGPVHHVVGREYDDGLDITIRIVAFLAVGYELLTVVGAIDVQASVILQRRRVGTEYAGTDRVLVARPLKVLRYCHC